ncbi:hypothetical protein KEM52_002765 [Ascosphaera acerosa]|nr:hypothetical protein KEM52_002765 [Ascosphaera acerosa]
MHRTYSMRNQRLPTASEMETPLPPPSTTKNNRLFSASFGHAFRRSTAGAFSPSLSKKLSQLVKMEKNVMRSIEQVSRERMEVAISEWGEGCDDDVSDVTDKIGVLLYEIAELEDQMVDRYDQYRLTLKSIRNIEKSVQPSRERKQKLNDEIAKIKYKEPHSSKLPILEQELVRAEAESLVAEAQLSNITREKVKVAFAYHFDSIREMCEKQAIIASFGKHLLSLVDDHPVTPGETRNAYNGYEASKAMIQDCEDALTHWTISDAAIRPALSIRTRNMSAKRHQRSSGQHEAEDQFREHDQPLSLQSSSIVSVSSRLSPGSSRVSTRSQRPHAHDEGQPPERQDHEHLQDAHDQGVTYASDEASRPVTAQEYDADDAAGQGDMDDGNSTNQAAAAQYSASDVATLTQPLRHRASHASNLNGAERSSSQRQSLEAAALPPAHAIPPAIAAV